MTNQMTPAQRMNKALSSEAVKQQFSNCLKENSGLFMASILDVYSSDIYLQKCDPGKVIKECLKAATLQLPINKNLGFAYVIAYKNEPQFHIGYKGFIQLAQRTGQYRIINADAVFEGELKGYNKLTGQLDLTGEKTSDKVIGYFAYIETVTGFNKTVYWDKERIEAHAKKYSMSYNSKHSPWKTDFDSMAIKTVIKQLFSKYGVMSVELTTALTSDADDRPADEQAQDRDTMESGSEVIDIDTETGEIKETKTAPKAKDKTQQPEMEF